jgi:RNA polymerase sigma-70 factor (ECF subfamily)
MMGLVAQAMAGDRPAFDELYRRFARSVHAILLSRVSPDDAEELMQEVFLTAHQKLADLRDPEAFGPWIHTIARNAATDRLRTKRPRWLPLREMAARPTDDGELRERVLAHIQSLPEAYRETLAMRLIEGLTGPEIAEQTGLAPASIRVNLHRGMELLRELLRKDGWP